MASVLPQAEPEIVLASRSPRRRELLAEAGVPHRVELPGFDDSDLEPGDVPAHQWVAALAYLKAWAVRERLGPDAGVVLGADTACVLEGTLIGTPRDAGEADTMIRAFAGREHEVVTGAAVVSGTGRVIFADRSRVRMGELAEDSIRAYIESNQWKGKAGAYNLSERAAAGWPLAWEGDPTTVMGLPMGRLGPILERVAGGTNRAAAEAAA